MLEIKNASVNIGDVTLFDHLSFSVSDGQMLCLTGDSGCGKTTLLRAILGFQPLNGGHVSIDGELLTPSSAEEFRKFMAYVPQDLNFPIETVDELVKLPFGLKVNSAVKFSKEKLLEEWHKLELAPELYDKKVSELSGGQRQRIVISLCGMLGKSIILADEPTAALDAHASMLVYDYLRNIAANGVTVVVVSHNEQFAEKCDFVVRIAKSGGEE